MKLTVPGPVLAEALNWVSAAVPVRPTTPILAGIRVEAAADGLYLTAFDYDTALRAHVDKADITDTGTAVLPGKALTALAGKIKGDLELTQTGPHVEITAGKARYVLRGMPVEDYPNPDRWFATDTTATVDAMVLHLSLGKVAHAYARDDLVADLSAVQVEAADQRLYLTTTDRFRMARNWMRYNGALGEGAVPAKPLIAAAKGLHGQVSIGLDDGTLTLADARHTAAIRTVKARKVTAILDKEVPRWSAKFKRLDMIEALDRIGVVDDTDRSHPIDLVIDEGSQSIAVRTHHDTTHAGTELLEATTQTTDPDDPDLRFPITVKLNPRYLLDAMKAHGVDDVEIGSRNPTKYTPVAIGGDSTLQLLVMPQRNAQP